MVKLLAALLVLLVTLTACEEIAGIEPHQLAVEAGPPDGGDGGGAAAASPDGGESDL
ncbi:MAG: hypothetical protein ABSE49_07585 [Polyangiaceae bacterium]|jgi:hypothetical protein